MALRLLPSLANLLHKVTYVRPFPVMATPVTSLARYSQVRGQLFESGYSAVFSLFVAPLVVVIGFLPSG